MSFRVPGGEAGGHKVLPYLRTGFSGPDLSRTAYPNFVCCMARDNAKARIGGSGPILSFRACEKPFPNDEHHQRRVRQSRNIGWVPESVGSESTSNHIAGPTTG